MSILMILMTGLLKIIYFVIKLFTKTNNKITFISRQSDSMPLDFLLLKEELDKRNISISTVFLCRKLEKTLKGILIYPFHMLRQMYNVATSKVVILDSYSIVVSVLKHKESLKVLQIWHSIGSMKKFGYTAIGLDEGASLKTAEIMKMHKNYDYIFAASSNYASDLAAGFGYDESIIVTQPLPRVDLLLNENFSKKIKEKIYKTYPKLNGKKNIVYCPTFRKEEDEHQRAIDELIESVNEDEFNLVIKLHPLSKIKIRSENIFLLDDFTSFESLFIADYVISDYSCIVYEAAIRNIPLFFYTFDLDKYEVERGLAIDLKNECPGLVTQEIKDIVESIELKKYDMNKLNKFANKYVNIQERNAKSIIDFIFCIGNLD